MAVIVDQVDILLFFVGFLTLLNLCWKLGFGISLTTKVVLNICASVSEQIKVPHPSYPSTCVSVQVPNLGIHFSPARYRRLMELLNILYGPKGIMGQPRIDSFEAELAPWTPIDLANDARILVWRVCLDIFKGAGHMFEL